MTKPILEERKRINIRIRKQKVAKEDRPRLKQPVIGIIERGGKVYALPVKSTDGATIKKLVDSTVKKGTKVCTDEWPSYNVLNKEYDREFVQHSVGEYVRGDVYTNSIENYWSLFKRIIIGIYHQTSEEHLESYVNEHSIRFNTRKLSDGSRFDITLANSQKRLTYNELIKRGA